MATIAEILQATIAAGLADSDYSALFETMVPGS